MSKTIRDRIVAAGVSNLKEYGYPDVNKENITEDDIYSAFFLSMLRDNLGLAGKEADETILSLIAQCEK